MAIEGNHKLLCSGSSRPGIHAEVDVIRKLTYMEQKHCIKWGKVSIIVVRIKKNESGDIAYSMSKPCVNCTRTIRASKIKKVIWSTDYDSFHFCQPCDLYTQHISRAHR